jgi:hypothetical protein
MRYVTIGRYQLSAALLLIAIIASPLAFAATYYLWNRKTVPFSVDEPLSVLDFPHSIDLYPGENVTLDITIVNSARASYTVLLVVKLSNAIY